MDCRRFSHDTEPLERRVWRGQFVAVGEGGTILTSPDGTAWTKRTSGNSLWLVGVGFGNGLFVVVGDLGTILTSPDGITWTTRRSGGVRINAVAYGNGTFLAVDDNGFRWLSSDGLTWSSGATNRTGISASNSCGGSPTPRLNSSPPAHPPSRPLTMAPSTLPTSALRLAPSKVSPMAAISSLPAALSALSGLRVTLARHGRNSRSPRRFLSFADSHFSTISSLQSVIPAPSPPPSTLPRGSHALHPLANCCSPSAPGQTQPLPLDSVARFYVRCQRHFFQLS